MSARKARLLVLAMAPRRMFCRALGHDLVRIPHASSCYRLNHQGYPDDWCCITEDRWV